MLKKLCLIAFEYIVELFNFLLLYGYLTSGHQFGYRANHSTSEQANRITNEIIKPFDRKQYCCGVFLGANQVFRVWHIGLIYKIKICALMESYVIPLEHIFME